MQLRSLLPLFILVFAFQNVHSQVAEDILLESQFHFKSALLNEERSCLLSLPESYFDSATQTKKYPILIVLDGASHFKTAAGIVHFMSSKRAGNRIMPEAIIVAIENVDRERDFTHTKIKTKRPNTMGGGRNFLKFIENELIPLLDENYRTTTHRTLIGHSLGGLLAINAFSDENSLFDSFLAIDPSIWWNEEMMNEKVAAISAGSFQKNLYIATANLGEQGNEKNKKRHEALSNLLNTKGGSQFRLKNQHFENENHRSVPLVALYYGLKFLHQKKE